VEEIELVIGKDRESNSLTINAGKSHAIFICGKEVQVNPILWG